MKKVTLAAVCVLLSAVAAHVEIFNYACGTTVVRIDDAKHIMEWKGIKYKLAGANCAKAGWHAKGEGASFDFCTATKGYADVEMNGQVQEECNLMRR